MRQAPAPSLNRDTKIYIKTSITYFFIISVQPLHNVVKHYYYHNYFASITTIREHTSKIIFLKKDTWTQQSSSIEISNIICCDSDTTLNLVSIFMSFLKKMFSAFFFFFSFTYKSYILSNHRNKL